MLSITWLVVRRSNDIGRIRIGLVTCTHLGAVIDDAEQPGVVLQDGVAPACQAPGVIGIEAGAQLSGAQELESATTGRAGRWAVQRHFPGPGAEHMGLAKVEAHAWKPLMKMMTGKGGPRPSFVVRQAGSVIVIDSLGWVGVLSASADC